MAVDDELLNKVTCEDPQLAGAGGGRRRGISRNAMTASWISQLSMEPVLIGVGVDNDAVTHRLITEGGSFTVNLWDAEETQVFVKFSKPAVDDGADAQRPPACTPPPPARPVFDEALAVDGLRRSATRSTSAPTRLVVGEIVDAAIRDDEARPASAQDRGEVRRHQPLRRPGEPSRGDALGRPLRAAWREGDLAAVEERSPTMPGTSVAGA